MLQRYADNGMAPPKWSLSAPEIPLGSDFVYEAFWQLDTCRSWSFGPGGIPWTAIDRYCVVHGIDGSDRDEFVYLIRQMDAEFRKYHSEQSSKN